MPTTKPFIADEMLEQLPAPAQVGKTKVGGIDLNKPRMRWVAEAIHCSVTISRWLHSFRVGPSGPDAQQPNRIRVWRPPRRLSPQETPGQADRPADQADAQV